MPTLDIRTNREFFVPYLSGSGLEIGALDAPLRVPAGQAKVVYVDTLTTEELRRAFPDVAELVEVGVVASAEELAPIPDASQDFIVANHVVEHLVDPLGTLRLWRRKLRSGGILYMAFPAPQHCPDRVRAITPVQHLIDDAAASRRRSVDEHILAFALAWNSGLFPDPESLRRVLETMWATGTLDLDEPTRALLGANEAAVLAVLERHRDDNIHQHVFSYDSMIALLRRSATESGLALRLLDVSLTKGCLSEYVLVLEAVEPGVAAAEFMTPRARAAERTERFAEGWIAEKDRCLEAQRTELFGLRGQDAKRWLASRLGELRGRVLGSR